MKPEVVSRIIAAIEECQLVHKVSNPEQREYGIRIDIYADILGEMNPDTGRYLTFQEYYNYLVNSVPEDIQRDHAFHLANGYYDSGIAVITIDIVSNHPLDFEYF